MESLTRRELTAALAARQLLLERGRLSPAEAIRRLTPLQGQHPPAPYIALAARLEGFTREALEADIEARAVVKTTIMRLTLHLAHAGDYPAYAELSRQFWLRKWRATYPHLDEEKVAAELGAWLREPRTNTEIRERVRALRRRARRHVRADLVRPRAAAGRPAPARRFLRRHATQHRVRHGPAAASRSRRSRRTRHPPLPRRLRPRPEARRGRLGRRRAGRLRRRVGARRDRHPPRRARAASCSTFPGSRSRPRTPAPAAPARPLGPGAARLPGPRADHPAARSRR